MVVWCLRVDSGYRHTGLQPVALPSELRRHIGDAGRIRTCGHWVAASSLSSWLQRHMVSAERLELPLTASETVVLPIRRNRNTGVPGRNRTCDAMLFRHTLYQLSYRDILATRTGFEPVTCEVTVRCSDHLNYRAVSLIFKNKALKITSKLDFIDSAQFQHNNSNNLQVTGKLICNNYLIDRCSQNIRKYYKIIQ